MQSDTHSTQVSKKMLWGGYVASAIPVLMLLASGVMKFVKSAQLVEGFDHLGWDVKLAVGLGILEIGCTVIYVIPRTSVLGAILLTGYLGGATAAHVRISESFLVPVLLGVLVWLGLFLRDPRLRALLPLR